MEKKRTVDSADLLNSINESNTTLCSSIKELSCSSDSQQRIKMRERVLNWAQESTDILNHMQSQLHFCKSLRSAGTIDLLSDLTNGVDKEKEKLITWLEIMKADIRSLQLLKRNYIYGVTEAKTVR